MQLNSKISEDKCVLKDPITAEEPKYWMWSEAIEMLAQVEHVRREFFSPQIVRGQHTSWEPSVDVIGTEQELPVPQLSQPHALESDAIPGTGALPPNRNGDEADFSCDQTRPFADREPRDGSEVSPAHAKSTATDSRQSGEKLPWHNS